MDVLVWVDDWQLQCCGDGFSVGSWVRWNLVAADRDWLGLVVGPAEAAAIAYAEEHHGGRGVERSGRVTDIREVHLRYGPVPARSRLCPVEGSGTFRSAGRADGYPAPIDGLEFGGYVVTLELSEQA